MTSGRRVQGRPGGLTSGITTAVPKGNMPSELGRYPLVHKELMKEREKYRKRKRLEELTRKQKDFIADRKRKGRSLKRPKGIKRFEDGGVTPTDKKKVKK